MGRPPTCACNCNYVLYSAFTGPIDDSGQTTVRFQSCRITNKKSGHEASLCTDIDDKGMEYHVNQNVNNLPVYTKRNSLGNKVWEYFGDADHIDAGWLTVDRNYNVYGVNLWVDGDSTPATPKSFNVFKLNRDGIEQWKSTYEMDFFGVDPIPGFEPLTRIYPNRITCDRDGNTLVTGAAEGHLPNVLCGIAAYFDTDGNLLWHVLQTDYITSYGSVLGSNFSGGAFTNNGDVIFGVGRIEPFAGTDYEGPHFFRFDSSGGLVWSKSLGEDLTREDLNRPVSNVCLDSEENLYVGGRAGLNFLKKYTGGDPEAEEWSVKPGGQLQSVYPGVVGLACNAEIPACVYLSVYRGGSLPNEEKNQAQRYSGADGSLQESIFLGATDDGGSQLDGLGAYCEGVIASPGRHPNFF